MAIREEDTILNNAGRDEYLLRMGVSDRGNPFIADEFGEVVYINKENIQQVIDFLKSVQQGETNGK